MCLPPLKNVSPFTVNSEDIQDYVTYKGTASTSTPADDEKYDSSDNTDPDILVLGFQELDLSAEALLISYTTDREEMWLNSIFAALGEARGQYTKVSNPV